MAGSHSLPLEVLELEWQYTFTDTAAECLVQFISNTTTLQYLRICWCTLSAHRLLELAKATHDNSNLQERRLENLRCTVNDDNEAKDLAQLLLKYPQVVDRCVTNVITQISDAGAVALAQALQHNSTLKELKLYY